MQLVFTVEEFRTLIRILRDRDSKAHKEEQFQDPIVPLLEKVLNRDFRFGVDELEYLEEILSEYSDKLGRELDESLTRDYRETLLRKQQLVRHIIDKVAEACAMV